MGCWGPLITPTRVTSPLQSRFSIDAVRRLSESQGLGSIRTACVPTGVERSVSVAFPVRKSPGDHGPSSRNGKRRYWHARDQKGWLFLQDDPYRCGDLDSALRYCLEPEISISTCCSWMVYALIALEAGDCSQCGSTTRLLHRSNISVTIVYSDSGNVSADLRAIID